MFLGLPTVAVLHDEYWGGCRLLEQGMVWEIVAGTYSGFGVCHSFYEDPFLLFNDNVTIHFHFLRVSCKMLHLLTCSSFSDVELVGKGG